MEQNPQPDTRKAACEALERVLASGPFAGSPKLGVFLRFVVDRTLAEDFGQLKETCIGLAVFGKQPSYDPKEDPIVRVEARRLRKKLGEYYAGEGAADTIRLDLPKGGYLIQVNRRKQDLPDAPSAVLPGPPAQAAPVLHPRSELPAAKGPGRLRWRFAWLAVALSLLAVTLSLLAAAFSVHRRPEDRYTHTRPLTSYPGNQMNAALSADGKYLAFAWDGEDEKNCDIYIKLVDSPSAIRLTTHPDHDLAPQWSHDGKSLSFLRVSPGGTALYVMPSLGGEERKIADLQVASKWKQDASQVTAGSGAAWLPGDGALIVSDGANAAADGVALYRYSLTGDRQRLTQPPTLANDYQAAVSPDGQQIAFVQEVSHSSGTIFLVNADGTALRQLSGEPARIRGLTWTDRNHLVFVSNRSGSNELWRVATTGKDLERVPASGSEISWPTAAQSNIIAYTSRDLNTNIWRIDLRSSSPSSKIFIKSAGRNDSAQYAPNGHTVVFASDRSGTWELWLADDEGRTLRQLTHFNGPMVGTPHWSPDSRYIVFDARPNGHSGIYRVAADGGAPTAIVDDGFENKKPIWSRDGRWIYFSSDRGGSSQLWRVDVHSAKSERLSDLRCDDSQESPDGRFIYFENDSPGVYRMVAAGGPAEKVPALRDLYPSRYLSVGNRIYYLSKESVPGEFWEFDPATEKSKRVVTITQPLVYGTPSLSISPDARYLLYAQQDYAGSQIISIAH